MLNFNVIPNPCYVLDEDLLRANLSLIKNVKEALGIDIIVAFKGFAMWSAFPILKEYGFDTATVSSLSEAQLAAEFLSNQSHAYSVVYSDDDIDEIAKISKHLTFNSLNQYERFSERVKKVNPEISLGLRVNPEYSDVEVELYNPAAPGSRLGIRIENMPDKLPDGVEGLHFHALCESDSHDLANVLRNFEEKFGKYVPNLKWVNFGGGHLMTRKNYDIDFLKEIVNNFQKKYPNVSIILEPGAAFAWETGYLLSKVEDIVENNGIKTAILNVSFTAHMPDCLEMPYQPKILGAEISETSAVQHLYRMGGNSCLSGDYVGFWKFNKELKIGDVVVFNDMIHYTMVKTTTFNGVKHPSIGIFSQEKGFRLVRAFGYEDYRNKLS
ncbi:carboxynorspermidine decarboxylase [Bacteroidia bacterium]|nr:carboxynorspermidine decarboxylase [Bacteroidia bacterium]